MSISVYGSYLFYYVIFRKSTPWQLCGGTLLNRHKISRCVIIGDRIILVNKSKLRYYDLHNVKAGDRHGRKRPRNDTEFCILHFTFCTLHFAFPMRPKMTKQWKHVKTRHPERSEGSPHSRGFFIGFRLLRMTRFYMFFIASIAARAASCSARFLLVPVPSPTT